MNVSRRSHDLANAAHRRKDIFRDMERERARNDLARLRMSIDRHDPFSEHHKFEKKEGSSRDTKATIYYRGDKLEYHPSAGKWESEQNSGRVATNETVCGTQLVEVFSKGNLVRAILPPPNGVDVYIDESSVQVYKKGTRERVSGLDLETTSLYKRFADTAPDIYQERPHYNPPIKQKRKPKPESKPKSTPEPKPVVQSQPEQGFTPADIPIDEMSYEIPSSVSSSQPTAQHNAVVKDKDKGSVSSDKKKVKTEKHRSKVRTSKAEESGGTDQPPPSKFATRRSERGLDRGGSEEGKIGSGGSSAFVNKRDIGSRRAELTGDYRGIFGDINKCDDVQCLDSKRIDGMIIVSDLCGIKSCSDSTINEMQREIDEAIAKRRAKLSETITRK